MMPDLTIKEVCAMLSISRQTFYNLDKQGAFPNQYRLKNWMRRIPLADIEALKSQPFKQAEGA
jgi:predicted DNA-binding transcriptional regulator AlpA